MLEFGEIKYMKPQSIWQHEALNFTPWLADNIQKLGTVLGLDLEIVEREANVGSFSLDLLARDLSTGHNVIIENQFGDTDHGHLGKLLTYAAGFDASTVIWISEKIRDEHRQALEWLNQRTDSDSQFFGIEIEVFCIDDSKPAFNFKPVVFPNGWLKTKGQPNVSKSSARADAYRAYFQRLIDELREKHAFTAAKVAPSQNWVSFASGISGASYSTSFAQGERVRAELYIDIGDSKDNKQLFDWFAKDKTDIEREFGEPLEWERLEDRRASRIAIYRPGSIESDEETLAEIQEWEIERLMKFKKVFSPKLKLYKKNGVRA